MDEMARKAVIEPVSTAWSDRRRTKLESDEKGKGEVIKVILRKGSLREDSLLRLNELRLDLPEIQDLSGGNHHVASGLCRQPDDYQLGELVSAGQIESGSLRGSRTATGQTEESGSSEEGEVEPVVRESVDSVRQDGLTEQG